MNRGQMKTEVRTIIGETVADFWTDTELNTKLNEALRRFSEAEKWPWLVTEVDNAALSVGNPLMDLEVGVSFPRHINFLLTPVGFVRPLQPKRVTASEGFKLRTIFATTQGDPLYFYVTSVEDEGANEVQTIVNGGSTAGTFTITFDGQTTGNIARGASAATIEAALKALSNIGPADVSCTGGPLGTDTVRVEFQRQLGRANVPEMTLGGTTTNMSVATVVSGGAPSGEHIWSLRFVPTPSRAFTVAYQYYRVPASLDDDSAVPDLPVQYHMALVHDAAANCWLKELNWQHKAAEQFELRNAILDQARSEYLDNAPDDFTVMGGEAPQFGMVDDDLYTRLRIPDILG